MDDLVQDFMERHIDALSWDMAKVVVEEALAKAMQDGWPVSTARQRRSIRRTAEFVPLTFDYIHVIRPSSEEIYGREHYQDAINRLRSLFRRGVQDDGGGQEGCRALEKRPSWALVRRP